MSEFLAREYEFGGMRSTLGWAVLGLVIQQPSYGYELAQRFKQVYEDTLTLSKDAHVYRLLDLLSSHELIEEIPAEAQEAIGQTQGHRSGPSYRATSLGVTAYQGWLVARMEDERHRQQLFARQLAVLEPLTALSVIERCEQEVLEDAGDAVPSETTELGQGPEGIAHRLADADERLALQVRLTWLAYARTELKTLMQERGSR